MSKVKIALALIVKPTNEEAEELKRCLANTASYVDGIFITQAGEKTNKKIDQLCELYGATNSFFKWEKDFAKARNFNFSQVPEDYTHILWCDADDVFRGLEKLRPTLEDNPNVDTFSLFYLYAFDEFNQPIVVHQKTQVVRNNGAVEWEGKLHEDFKENREIIRSHLKGVERLHMTSDERIKSAKKRNVEIAEVDQKENPSDPRSYWNLGCALFSAGKWEESVEPLEKFIELSGSAEEKYLTHIRLGFVNDAIGDKKEAVRQIQFAIGIRPEYPDAYHALGDMYFRMENYPEAIRYFIQGMSKKPPYYSIIAYNPRDYDYVPLMTLAKAFFQMSRPDQALVCLESAAKIYPDDPKLQETIKNIKKEADVFEKVLKTVQKLDKIKDDKKLQQELDKLPEEIKSHPSICVIRNKRFVKKESSGKDLVIMCGMTHLPFNPDSVEKGGIGGSEEAVIYLSKELAELGWNVEVYANCGHEVKKYGNVTWKPFWMWNYRDKQDVTIFWRRPRFLEYKVNSDKVYLDVHDALSVGEFTEERLELVDKIFFKTKFHRGLYPDIPDDKVAIIPNGMDLSLIPDIEKNQKMLLNTSSPERSMDVLPDLFAEVKKQVPDAKLVWAYGWGLFDLDSSENEKEQAWKQETVKKMEDLGIIALGKITQVEVGKLYAQANVLAYPSEFAEIDCISVKKAQAGGCVPVATDFGAFNESIKYGVKVHSDKTQDNWAKDRFAYGLENKEAQKEWVDSVVKLLKEPIEDRSEMKEWAKTFEWDKIAKRWNDVI